MKFLASLRSFASVLFRRSRVEGEMEEELRSHIQNRMDDLQASGLTRAEAERQARVEFGSYEHFKEECRESVGANFLETFLQDIRFGARLLRKSPGFTAVAILTLALGIGANTAIFSVVYAVLLRPLPYAHPDQLVFVFESNVQEGVKVNGCSYVDLMELQRRQVFSKVAGLARHGLTLTGSGDPAEVRTVVTSPEIFPLLNVSPLAGRYLIPEDQKQGAAPVVVVNEGLWRTRFGANPNLIGTSITLDQRPFTVVGIMPASFRIPGLGTQEIWIPTVQDPLLGPWMPQPGGHWLGVIGRLNEGVSLAHAQLEMEAVSKRLADEFPEQNKGWMVRLAPLHASLVEDLRTPLLVLLGAAALLLLLACVNIANLLLARATSRTREVALRQALGAGRSRIVRQLLTESAMLGMIGAVLGIVLAYWGAQTLGLLLPSDMAGAQNTQVDLGVLGFALVLSLAATIAFGLGPALLTAKSDVQANLKDSPERSGSTGGRLRARSFLATGEIALAVVLVTAAGLLMRSLLTMTAVDPGFDASHILKAQVSLPRYQYSKPQQWKTFSDTLLERIQAQPGMQDSAVAVPLPLADGFVNLGFVIPDHAAPPAGTSSTADYVSVSPGYFHVMGIPLLQGRLFAAQDSDASLRVAIVSESFARIYFRDENPIGRRLVFGFPPNSNVSREIIGVVGNVRDTELAQEPKPMMYVPFAQEPFWGGDLVVKSSLPPAALVGVIRQVVRSLDKDLPITDIATMPDVLNDSVSQPRFRTWLLSAFGLIALLLAAAGIFGVVSYSVASRIREFGVRSALGASPASIRKMILLEGLRLSSLGLIAGLAVALGLARFLKSELYGVASYDPATFATSIAVLLAVALLACYIPARRAMRVDPMIALRCE